MGLVFERTLIHDSKLLPYLFWNASLISPKSISERLTMMRINVLSLVPRPAIDAWRRSAKKSTFDLQHLTGKLKLNSLNCKWWMKEWKETKAYTVHTAHAQGPLRNTTQKSTIHFVTDQFAVNWWYATAINRCFYQEGSWINHSPTCCQVAPPSVLIHDGEIQFLTKSEKIRSYFCVFA